MLYFSYDPLFYPYFTRRKVDKNTNRNSSVDITVMGPATRYILPKSGFQSRFHSVSKNTKFDPERSRRGKIM